MELQEARIMQPTTQKRLVRQADPKCSKFYTKKKKYLYTSNFRNLVVFLYIFCFNSILMKQLL